MSGPDIVHISTTLDKFVLAVRESIIVGEPFFRRFNLGHLNDFVDVMEDVDPNPDAFPYVPLTEDHVSAFFAAERAVN